MYEVILKETNEVLGYHQQPERANIIACWFASNKAFDLDPIKVNDLSGLFAWEQIEGNNRNNWHELYEVKYNANFIDMKKLEQEIRDKYSAKLKDLVNPYTDAERETWYIQEREARAYVADPLTNTPYLSTLAATRGITVDELATKVMENISAFEVASATLLGLQQKELDELYSE